MCTFYVVKDWDQHNQWEDLFQTILPTSSFIVVYIRYIASYMIIHKQWGCNCAVCLFLVSPLLWRCFSLYSVCLPLL